MVETKLKINIKNEFYAELNSPSAIVIDKENNILVVEEFSHRIKKFNNSLKKIWEIGKKGNGSGEFIYPTSIAVNSQNDYFVSDRWNHRIQRINAKGEIVDIFGKYGEEKDDFIEPWGIAILANDDLLVVDRGVGKVICFDNNYKFKSDFGIVGPLPNFYEKATFKNTLHYKNWINRISRFSRIESLFFTANYPVGQFEYPENIAIDPNGRIYITDKSNKSIAIFNQDYKSDTFIDGNNNEYPDFATDICTFNKGIFVADEINTKLYWFDYSLGLKGSWNLKEFALNPTGIFYSDIENLLYVADVTNNKIVNIEFN